MSKTLTNLRSLFLDKINQSSSNHDFGSDYTIIDRFLNEAYLEIGQETDVFEIREALAQVAAQANYIIGTDVFASVNNPLIKDIVDYENHYLNKITPAQYSLRPASSGTPYEWTIISSYSGSPTAEVRTLYLYPTPSGTDTLYLVAEIIPDELSATTDVPIWDEVYSLHNIVADVAVAKALHAIGDLRFASYSVEGDAKVRRMRSRVMQERDSYNRDPGPVLQRAQTRGVTDYPLWRR